MWQDTREANLLDGGAPNYRCYAASDGQWMAVGAIEPQFWAELVQALELYLDQTPSPYDPSQRQACTALLTSIFRTRTRDEWASLFEHRDAGVAPALRARGACA